MDKKRIIDIIENDATLIDSYSDSDGDMCVIGGLAFECGISKEYLEQCGELEIRQTPLRLDSFSSKIRKQARMLGKVRRLLKETFGLSLRNLSDLQEINDREKEIYLRREKLINYVQSI